MIFSDLAMGGVFLGFGVSGPIAVAAVLLGLIGFLSGYVQVRLAAWIQTNVPREMVGRVTSIYILILSSGPLAAIVAGAILQATDVRTFLVGTGAGLIVIATVAALFSPLRSIGPASPQQPATTQPSRLDPARSGITKDCELL